MIDWYRLAWPALRAIEPERAHRLALWALRAGLVPGADAHGDPILAQDLWGMRFMHPVGLAAGFDKNAEVPDAMLRLGFGFVEVGGVTPRPQPGNAKPRLFRLEEDRAIINRMGLNSEGAEAVAARLARRRRVGIVGVNLGRNKDTLDPIDDYLTLARRFAGLADFLVCNISSPNTPGLRDLQARNLLTSLIGRLQGVLREATDKPPPLLIKIAPDLSPAETADVAEVALATKVDGMIVSNTTIARPVGLASRHRGEVGGLSGRPLFVPSTALLSEMFRLTGGRIPLVGVGGIASGADAYAKIRAGASLVQLYAALVFRGPALVGRIRRELAECLRADGFASIGAAIGANHR
jgi:dihydroorotate dehydrogenase